MTAEESLSKTQRKRDMQALQDLGSELAELSPEHIRSLHLPENLEHALLEVKTFSSHGAVRRQMQFIGKLMREVDPAPLQAHLDRFKGRSREATALHHLTERWRERMLETTDAVDEFAASHRTADRQQLRQLALAARRERDAGKPPKQFRELFRIISKTLADQHPAAANGLTQEPDAAS